MRPVQICSLVLLFVVPQVIHAQKQLPPPQFTDPQRKQKLAAAFPEIEKLFKTFMERSQSPGAVFGVIVDGELVWVKAGGVREKAGNAAVTNDTVFRIASMTKSFTAMAILKLRDEGKLSLDDPASKYVPELAKLSYPTSDSPVLTVRHLLTHSEGFPEDNPWGDRQLAQSDETMRAWLRTGIAWGTCKGGEPLSGNGTRNSAIRFTCDNGPLAARIVLDPTSHKLTNLDLVPLREQRCVP